MASLLEVGTGFHPELTGRENIYLNGAILGMTREEIRRKFDEIVAFAEVEKFLDTPVKRYSSGMYVRLAFAVAAHLEPEILLVDEVLAVGDIAFQKKSLQRLQDITTSGTTILFISHDLSAIATLCAQAILLRQGRIAKAGMAASVIQYYQQESGSTTNVDLSLRLDRRGDGGIKLTKIRFFDENGNAISTAISGKPILITLEYKSERKFSSLEFAIGIRTINGTPLVLCRSVHDNNLFDIEQGMGTIDCYIPNVPLAEGSFYLNVAIQHNTSMYDWIERAATLDVIALDFYGNGSTTPKGHSPFLIKSQWQKANQSIPSTNSFHKLKETIRIS
ncbi:MAG: ABC transporter ATP-binding protein [Caldilineaceae bacterium]|nr:ABC transporter ATP-binding protein [Caldilineaceae bacterium]